MKAIDLGIDQERLDDLCRRYGVAKLEAFGSVAAGTVTKESDVDLLVTFRPGVRDGLDFVALSRELEDLLGRPVDLLTRCSVERSPNKYFRRFALRRTESLYERA